MERRKHTNNVCEVCNQVKPIVAKRKCNTCYHRLKRQEKLIPGIPTRSGRPLKHPVEASPVNTIEKYLVKRNGDARQEVSSASCSATDKEEGWISGFIARVFRTRSSHSGAPEVADDESRNAEDGTANHDSVGHPNYPVNTSADNDEPVAPSQLSDAYFGTGKAISPDEPVAPSQLSDAYFGTGKAISPDEPVAPSQLNDACFDTGKAISPEPEESEIVCKGDNQSNVEEHERREICRLKDDGPREECDDECDDEASDEECHDNGGSD
eukprot:GHVU01026913.1.p1 GENE.GHVU01026913.1~~GHVU01026913.1.p1  ORF type:complete len:268 (+),score=20.48 GHVU01026913.1:1991-2794(+)